VPDIAVVAAEAGIADANKIPKPTTATLIPCIHFFMMKLLP